MDARMAPYMDTSFRRPVQKVNWNVEMDVSNGRLDTDTDIVV
jgi:hypothetical protein